MKMFVCQNCNRSHGENKRKINKYTKEKVCQECDEKINRDFEVEDDK